MLTMLMMKTLGAIVNFLFTNLVFPHSSLLCSTGAEASAIGVESSWFDNERIDSAEAHRAFENLMVGGSVRGQVVKCQEARESRSNSLRALPYKRICNEMRSKDKQMKMKLAGTRHSAPAKLFVVPKEDLYPWTMVAIRGTC